MLQLVLDIHQLHQEEQNKIFSIINLLKKEKYLEGIIMTLMEV